MHRLGAATAGVHGCRRFEPLLLNGHSAYRLNVGFFIVVGGAFGLVFLLAFVLDLQDRRRGRKSRMRPSGWLRRQAQFDVATSPLGYWMTLKGVGPTYSTESWRDGTDKPELPPDRDEPI
jgi:hypothetical protein